VKNARKSTISEAIKKFNGESFSKKERKVKNTEGGKNLRLMLATKKLPFKKTTNWVTISK
jgi:hypothetical protein